MASSHHHHQLPELFPFNPVSSWLLLRLSATACLCKCLQCFVCLTINTLPIITREHYGASHDTIPWWMMSGNGTIVGAKYSLTYWSENLCVCVSVWQLLWKRMMSVPISMRIYSFLSRSSRSLAYLLHTTTTTESDIMHPSFRDTAWWDVAWEMIFIVWKEHLNIYMISIHLFICIQTSF